MNRFRVVFDNSRNAYMLKYDVNGMTQREAAAEANRLNAGLAKQAEAQIAKPQSMDIESGLGIGGVGSDDYSIHTETPVSYASKTTGRKMARGQLWEPCPRCGTEPVCVDCGYCKTHCKC